MPTSPLPAAPRAPDLAAEQAVVDTAYDHLARMRARARQLLVEMSGADPDLEWALARRVKALSDTPRALCFGRTDGVDGTTWYIGRRHVEDESGDPVVIEWRAPVALPFYRATWSDPMGLERRRQFVVDGRDLLSIGDDWFGSRPPAALGPEVPEHSAGLVRTGEMRGGDALLVELERARTGEMLDIVATIQPEQDEVIRAPVEGVLAVQGGPGSGKTAVGLHRAAFLLYADDAMARANILVVGPNRTFLRYIAHVLPSLGEHAVVQTTLGDLVPEVEAGLADAPPTGARDAERWNGAERLKGDARLAEVLARALGLRRRPADADVVVTMGLRRLAVPAAACNDALETAASRRIPYSAGRDLLRDLLVRALYDRYVEVAGLPPDGSELGRALRAAPGLKAGLDARWPAVAPAALVAELLSRPAALAAAAAGILSPDEQKLLLRRRARAWSPADAALVDEAKDLVNGQARTYGYAIVDEAQDLSPMELRMLARRCPSGALTLLGDLAQAVGPWGLRDWGEVAERLAAKELRMVELRHGYRSTAQVLDFAARLLPEAAPQVTPVAAVRRGRRSPTVERVGPGEVVTALVREGGRLAAEYPMVGLVVPASLVEEAARVALESLPSAGEASRHGLSRPVTVVSAQGAKGLEFDAVVVAEPAAIVAERADAAAGLRLLYVALTRPTQHLAVVHSQPLPAPLGRQHA
ncbi:MAG TPA: ATP-binding domain-containing protein [Acidimicrobiales bacterium]|nr:ATP-binding domain-containing protein [Acidimicrobiales bacterium]